MNKFPTSLPLGTHNNNNSCGNDNRLNILFNVSSSSLILNWDTDESYWLVLQSVNENELFVKVEATSVFGARHAMETLSQLMVTAPKFCDHQE